MTVPKTVRLGDLARDKISGFEGIVVQDVHYLAGCQRIVLMSRNLEKGEPIGQQTFDAPNLIVVKRAVVPTIKTKFIYKLGDMARDMISGYSGVITSVSYHLSGEIDVGITPKEMQDGVPMPELAFSQSTVEAIKPVKEKTEVNGLTGGNQCLPKRAY